jgi:hypothetical protein
VSPGSSQGHASVAARSRSADVSLGRQAPQHIVQQITGDVDPAEAFPDETEEYGLELELRRAPEASGQVSLDPATLPGREAAVDILVQAADHVGAG